MQKIIRQKQKAFTIVELLIVVVVIGVLATITVVSYTGIQNKAVVASLVSDLGNTSKLLSIDWSTNGNYPSSLAELNNNSGARFSSDTSYQYYPNSKSYCLMATRNGLTYRMTSNGKPRLGPCSGLSKDSFSAIKWNTWTVSVGSVSGYSINGDGNSRIFDTNPWGETDIVWDVSDQDAASDADGGWVTSNFAIDNSKTYRYSVFVRRKYIGNGSFYLGLNGYPDAVLNRSNGLANTNPYFTSRAWWGDANSWYLVVGYVWPADSGTGAVKPESGIYSMDGTKLINTSDYVWQSTTTSARHRAYLYYSTDILTNQQFYQPRVDIVDGTEPSISELLSDVY